MTMFIYFCSLVCVSIRPVCYHWLCPVLWSITGKVSIIFILCYLICNTFMLKMEAKPTVSLTYSPILDILVFIEMLELFTTLVSSNSSSLMLNLEFTLSGVRVTQSLVLCLCFVDRCLSLCPLSFWSLWCLSFFDSWILITPLVSSNSS